jgi:hypothetical protein
MKYYTEKYYPIAVSVLLTIAWIVFKKDVNNFPGLIDKLSDNSIGLSTTLVGFFLTILTLINSIDTRRMNFVRSAGAYPRLIAYLNQSIRTNVVLIALSFIVKYVEHRSVPWLLFKGYNILDYGFLFLLIVTLLISVRFINIFVSLLADPKT